MAVQSTPYVETALSHNAELFRRELQAGLPLGSAGGIVPATPGTSVNFGAGVTGFQDLVVSAPASGMSVNVAAGGIIIPGSLGSTTNYGMPTGYGYPIITTNGGSAPTISGTAKATQIALTTQGSYYGYNDYSGGLINLTISAANPTYPRIDVVVAQAEDADYSGSNNDWKLAVITGTDAASPTVPTLPASCVPLALVWVPANASSIIAADIIDLRVAYNRNPYKAYIYRNAAWSGSTDYIPFDTVFYDHVGMASGLGGSAVLNVPVTGIWAVTATYASTGQPDTDEYGISVYNGATRVCYGMITDAGGAAAQAWIASYIGPFNMGATINIQALFATTLTSEVGVNSTNMSAILLSPQ